MNPRVRLVGATLIALLAMGTVLLGTWQSAVPFVSPAELDASLLGRRVQVEGLVRGLEPYPEGLRFDLSDGMGAVVAVEYRYGAGRPLALDEGRLAIAKGVYRDGRIVAQQVSVRAHEGVEEP
ncbi:MAG: cytochrome c maturation protein CcmE [Trueperaceae bacterium]|nr:cytochrome c maturation protein CcmE [Trueperaceae bacterium]